MNDVPELKGVKMLVWDTNESNAVERYVYGQINGSLFASDHKEPSWLLNLEYVKHAKPLPQPRKVTMEEVCAKFGEDVVIEKGA